MTLLDAEDAKIVTLARSARARTGAEAGAAVRDHDGRTYAGASVSLESLSLSAIQVAVVMAASAGAQGLEAVATDAAQVQAADLAAVRDLAGTGVPLLRVDARGDLVERLLS